MAKLTLQSLPEDWIEKIVPIYENGGGDEEAMAALRITQQAFLDLYREEIPFQEVIDYGRLARQAWFLKWGRENLTTRGAQYSGWYKQMCNLYGWSDKKPEGIGEGDLDNLSDEQVALLMGEAIKMVRELDKKTG